MDGGRWADAGAVGPRSHEFATGLATWYLRHAEVATLMQLGGRDGTVTRQGDGQTEYDETVQPGAVGMEVERSTDGAVEAGRGATGPTTASSTDTTTASTGVTGMEVERPTDGAVGLGRDATGTTTASSTDTTTASTGVTGMEVERPTDGAVGLGRDATGATTASSTGGSGREAEMGTTAVRVARTRRYHAGASEGLTRGERRKLAKAKKRAAR